jgi:HD-GYP domain-containing protein (c-di-GMP phosphodiesterase class II)
MDSAQVRHGIAGGDAPDGEWIRAAEVISALSLATDLGIGVPLEHGLHSTLIAMRLVERAGVDAATASQTYYACLLFYVGCTANADLADELFGGHDVLTTYGGPVRFGSRPQMIAGVMRAMAPTGDAPHVRAAKAMSRLPRFARVIGAQSAAMCEVAMMLTDRLSLPADIGRLFAHVDERWDGKGRPGRSKRNEVPLAVRIAQVSRDAAFQRMLGGVDFAARVVRDRAGKAFDPDIAGLLTDNADMVLGLDDRGSAWDATLGCEPSPRMTLKGKAIERALAAMGDFADLVSTYLVGHSRGVAELASTAATRCGLAASEVVALRHAALVHDVGRVAVPVRVWQKPGELTPDEWEGVRLHAYHSERILNRSPFLAALAPVATTHHERVDGSGYHRGSSGAVLTPAARLLAAADALHAMTEPRPHRNALGPAEAAESLGREARAGRLDPDAVSAVVEASGMPAPRVERPAGLTEREARVVGLLARGLATKQVARALGISVKTADRHIQNAYGKIGISTRAAAALFAMQHGLAAWGELPIVSRRDRS